MLTGDGTNGLFAHSLFGNRVVHRNRCNNLHSDNYLNCLPGKGGELNTGEGRKCELDLDLCSKPGVARSRYDIGSETRGDWFLLR